MAITGAVGAFCGSLLTTYVPVALLLSFIGIIVSYESVVLIRGKSKIRNESDTKDESMSKNKILLIESIIGFAIGFLGGLVGLVLGSIRLPTMISVLKMKPSVAIGTNLATSSVMGISGLIGHLVNNEVDFLILSCNGFCGNDWWIYGSKLHSPVQRKEFETNHRNSSDSCCHYNVHTCCYCNMIADSDSYTLFSCFSNNLNGREDFERE